MGRVKLKIQRLESLNNRQVTYGKRRNGILKKAQELSVLCDIEIFLLMFSPSGKPSVFCGERSNIAEMIAKYAQLTPKERAKRRLESLETLKRNFKKVDQDVDIEEFLNASHPSVEEMRNQVALLKGRVGEVHKRLSWWANPDKIDDVEHLSQMENSLRDTLNRVHMQKEKFAQNQLISFDCTSQSQNPMTFPVIPTGDQDCQTQSWLPGGMPQQMMLPNEPHFLTNRDMDCSRDPSFPNCSGFFGTFKPQDLDKAMPSKTERQDDGISIDDYAGSSYLRLPLGNGNGNGNGNGHGKAMPLKNERQDDGISVDDYAGSSYVRLPLGDQFPCPSYGNLSFPYMMDPGRDANFQPSNLDYQLNGNFELPRSVYNSMQHSLVPPPGSCAISMFNDNAYPQPPNQFNA